MHRFEQPGHRNGLIRAMLLAGFTSGTLLVVKDDTLPLTHLQQEVISRSPPAKRHLGINQLVHGAGNSTIPAPHAPFSIHIDSE
jgi:hypothetical protein